MSHDRSVGLEAREGEGLDELLERNAVLQTERNGDGKVVHQRAEGRALFVHVDEYLADLATVVFARPEVDFVPADDRLLRVPAAA